MAKRLYIQLYNANTGESLTLPLNPETTDIPNSREIKTYNILNYGEVPVSGYKELKRITLTNILPENNTTWALLASMIKQLEYKSYSPIEAMEMINSWIDNDEKIRVIISGYLNAEFKIEKHVSQIKESVSDIGYSIDLVEYKNPAEETKPFIGQNSKLVQLKERTINKYIPSQLTGKIGQTIYKIAKLTYGGRFNELAKLNSIVDQNQEVAGRLVEMLPL